MEVEGVDLLSARIAGEQGDSAGAETGPGAGAGAGASGAGAQGSAGRDDVVDAEFEEVKDKDRKAS